MSSNQTESSNQNIEQSQNTTSTSEEITIKIKAMDKDFSIKIQNTLTIKELKEKLETVNFILILFYLVNRSTTRKTKINFQRKSFKK